MNEKMHKRQTFNDLWGNTQMITVVYLQIHITAA